MRGGGYEGSPGSYFYRPGNRYEEEGEALRRLKTFNTPTHLQQGREPAGRGGYPEGGWGWIVCACAFLAHVTTSGVQLSAGALHIILSNKFADSHVPHLLGGVSWTVSCLYAPLAVNLCRRRNAKILSFVGGLLFPIALLSTSFASELHQIFFTFGLFGGIGGCLVRESSSVVLGTYFRRRRQFVEQVVLAGTGVGVTLFSLLYLSLSRHIEWGVGFRIGAALSAISALLPIFYRYPPSSAQTTQRPTNNTHKGVQNISLVFPLCGDICQSLNLFCVPALKPVLWSAAISSFGLYSPLFLMSDFGRREGLSGGSLLLLQTHLGLGISLGVILAAIVTIKRFKTCFVSPRILATIAALLTGISMIAISTVEGYYGYSLSAWIYGVSLGAYLYTLKMLTMDLTRSKHWERMWSTVQCLMSPGILLGSAVTSYLGKPGFFLCATAVLAGAVLIGLPVCDLTKCASPPPSSSDGESPIPPAPPPVPPTKYSKFPGSYSELYPLRRAISLQQGTPCCCSENCTACSYCRDCFPYGPGQTPYFFPSTGMIRSFSLPQEPSSSSLLKIKTQGTQTAPSSPTQPRAREMGRQGLAGKRQQHKHSVMFASNPQLYSPNPSHAGPDEGKKDQFVFPAKSSTPAFTRHYFDSSKITAAKNKKWGSSGSVKSENVQVPIHIPPQKPKEGNKFYFQQHVNNQHQTPPPLPPHSQNLNQQQQLLLHRQYLQQRQQQQLQQQQQQQKQKHATQQPYSYQQGVAQGPLSSLSGYSDASGYSGHSSHGGHRAGFSGGAGFNSGAGFSGGENSDSGGFITSGNGHWHHSHSGREKKKSYKVSSVDFNVEEPKFNSLRRPLNSNGGHGSNCHKGHGGHGGHGSHGHAFVSVFPPTSGYPYPPTSTYPLSLNAAGLKEENYEQVFLPYPHHMMGAGPIPINYSHGQPKHFARRNTWNSNKDNLEAITTSI